MAVYETLTGGHRVFDREAFDADTVHLDALTRKYALLAAVARFRKRPPIDPELRRQVFARDGYLCLACGSMDRLSLDHVTPYSRGGQDTLANLQTLCLSCNCSKGAKV